MTSEGESERLIGDPEVVIRLPRQLGPLGGVDHLAHPAPVEGDDVADARRTAETDAGVAEL